jgi:hypothetical protein
MQKAKSSKATAIIALIVASLFLAAIPVQIAKATTITSIDPTEGPVGTEVRVIGNIDVLGGDYEITWDDTLVLESDTCDAGSTAVDVTVTVPSAVWGDHNITLVDAFSLTEATAVFTVTTTYEIDADPDWVLEGTDTSVEATIHGGYGSTSYTLQVNVTDSTGDEFSATFSATTNSTGSIEGAGIMYPSGFSGANTDFTGLYSINLDVTAPGKILSVASGNFTVAVVEEDEYRRYDTVVIQGSDYSAGESVEVDIEFGGSSISGYPKTVTADEGGLATDTWDIPSDQAMGTYTVTLTGDTTSKTPADTSDFEVKGALLSVTITEEAVAADNDVLKRTETASIKFTVSYPGTVGLFNWTHLGAVSVGVWYNDTKVTDLSLSSVNYDVSDGEWSASWKIPKDAPLGINYNFTFEADTITDKNGNSGPDDDTSTMYNWEVGKADLMITKIDEPSAEVNRTKAATMEFQINYPDLTVMSADDMGEIKARVYYGTDNVDNVTLTAADFDGTNWAASWIVPWNETLGAGYTISLEPDFVEDKWENAPLSTVDSNPFDVTKCVLDVPAISTDSASYAIGDIVTVYFSTKYLDGSSVTTGDAIVWVIRADGTKQDLEASYDETDARWEALFTVGYPVGIYTVKIVEDEVNDMDSDDLPTDYNMGPADDISMTFEVYEVVTLSDVMAQINAIDAALSEIEATVGTLGGDVSGLQSDIDAVKSDLASLKASAATKTDLTSEISALETSVAALKEDVTSSMGGLSTNVLIALVLSLVAAVAAIAAVILIYSKIA